MYNRPPSYKKRFFINLPPPIVGLIGLIIALQLFVRFLPEQYASAIVLHLALIPPIDVYDGRQLGTLVSYALLHGGWFHFFVNVAMLAAFGKVIALSAHTKLFWFVTIISAIGGALGHLLIFPLNPLIGSSGIISGYIGALYFLGHFRFWLPAPLDVKKTRQALCLLFIIMIYYLLFYRIKYLAPIMSKLFLGQPI